MFLVRRRRRRRPILLVVLFSAALGYMRWQRRGFFDDSPDPGAVPSATSTTTSTSARVGPYRVVKVVDGDTIDVETGEALRKNERIRLLCINTPERDEAGYERATAALKAKLEQRSVELEFEVAGKPDQDAFHRLLAYVVLDGRNVNVEMVREGWTKFFTKYGEHRLAADFRAAEEEARMHEHGLWTKAGWNVSR